MPKVNEKYEYLRKPEWLKISLRSTANTAEVEQIVEGRCRDEVSAEHFPGEDINAH